MAHMCDWRLARCSVLTLSLTWPWVAPRGEVIAGSTVILAAVPARSAFAALRSAFVADLTARKTWALPDRKSVGPVTDFQQDGRNAYENAYM